MLRQATRLVAGLSLLCLAPCVGIGLAEAAKDKKTDPRAAALTDPRSGAALNREAAKAARAAGKAAVPGGSAERIHHSTVNDASADSTAQDTQSETSVIDLGGANLVAAFNDSGSFLGGANHFTGYAYSTNGGLSWTDPGRLPDSVEGDAGDPVLAFSKKTGAVFIVTLGFNTGESLQVFKSADQGHTFGAPVNGTPGFGGSGDFQDKPWMTVDNFGGGGKGNIYLCWTRFGATEDILFTRSTDDGATFGPSGGTLVSSGGQGCFVVVSPNHQVNVFYYRGTGGGGQGGDNKIFTRRSTDFGVTFAPEVQVADLNTTSTNGDLVLKGGVRSNSFPHAAVNPVLSRPYLYVIYNDDPNLADASDNGDIFVVSSTNGGASWSAPVKFNDADTGDQFFPTIAFAAEGERLMLGYYSRSQDTANLAFHRRAALGVLTGPGVINLDRSFQLSPNTPIAIGQDPVINPTYMGDYDQIAGGSNVFSSTWSDNRLGNGFHRNQPDVRFARITVPPPAADLTLSAAASPAGIDLGQNTVITVTATSSGGTANDVFLNMAEVPGLAIESVNSSTGQCNTINGFIGCYMGPIIPGAPKTVEIVATGVGAAGNRSFKARGTTSSQEPSVGNNAATVVIPVATGSSVITTASTGSVAIPLPDLATTEIPLAVSTEGKVAGVRAYVRLNHTFDSDLRLFVVAPTGQTVELSSDNGGAGANYGSGANDCTSYTTNATQFNDFAAASIVGAAAPFAGSFIPEQPLQSLVGVPTDGVWKLRVVDHVGGDSGTLGCFVLRLTRAP